jgi:lysophospholipase L1-like esterase
MNIKSCSLLAAGVLVGCSAESGELVGERGSALSPGVYVALGDSYSSGVGSREYYDNANGCMRSEHAYAFEVAAARGYQLEHVACSGARVPDVRANQLGALSSATTLVTMSIGGNDAGFVDVVTACAGPWPTTCWGKIDTARAFISDTLPGVLNDLYSEIRTRAPNARVVIVGYPKLFNGEECNSLARISPEEQAELNETADLLSNTISGVAQSHGFDYVDVRGAFTGHAVCDDVEWVNGVSNPIAESYHPNVNGYEAYADLILSRL